MLEERLPVRCPDCGRLVASTVGLNAHRRMMHSVAGRRAKPGLREAEERVPASSLQRHDRLVLPNGARFELLDVVQGRGEVRLRSETLGSEGGAGKWFTVAPVTMFVRVVQDRTIDTRPDLSKEASERGSLPLTLAQHVSVECMACGALVGQECTEADGRTAIVTHGVRCMDALKSARGGDLKENQ